MSCSSKRSVKIMKRYELVGLGKVYKFTLIQQLKNKASLVSAIILMVFCLASVPVMSMMGGGSSFLSSAFDDSDGAALLAGVCLENETGLPIVADTAGTRFANVPFDDEMQAAWGELTARVRCYADENGYHVSVSGNSIVKDSDLSDLAMLVQQWLQEAKLAALDVDEAQLAALSAAVSVDADELSEYLDPDGQGFGLRFAVSYFYAVLVLILCAYAASYIVRFIVEEKASRLVELLMVSVRPLALVLGKILAMMTYIFGMLLSMALCWYLSYLGTSLFGDVSAAAGLLDNLNLSSLQIDAWTVVVVVVSLLLAYGGFSLMAGLAGTCCSQIDEINGATSTVMFTVLVGYLVSIGTSMIRSGGLSIFLTLCPVVNVFCAPVQYALGGIGLGWLLVSWAEQALIVAALAILTARVYRQLLLSRGAKVKLRQLLSMAKREAA